MSRFALLAVAVSCSSPPKPMPHLPDDSKPKPVDVAQPAPPEDPFLWLEDVGAEKSLEWARARNATSKAELEAVPSFAASRDRVRAILDSKDKIPYVSKLGGFYYNFWTDAQHKKGVWRRTTLAEFKKKEPAWETVLDIDALSDQEHESWVFKGSSCQYPKYERCLIELSKGGGDAVVIREFDLVKKAFIADGFVVPEAKGYASYKDNDTLYIGTDSGPGSMTKSGYPRFAKEWKRGTKLADAKTILEAKEDDMIAEVSREWVAGKPRDWASRRPSFFAAEMHLIDATGKSSVFPTPIDASLDSWNDQLLVNLRSDWKIEGKTWPAGALLAMPFADFVAGKRTFTMLFEPAPNRSLDGTAGLESALIVNELEDVRNKIYVWKLAAGKWTRTPFEAAGAGSTSIAAVDPYSTSDDFWMVHTDYITPSTLSLGKVGSKPTVLKQSPGFFDATGLEVTQHFATSKDGTKIPYSQISRKSLALDGTNPTVLYGYGGFEISETPTYSATSGALWSSRGGVYVDANIRGGGEYGPRWHQAALRHDRQRAYDDFIAIAEDLIKRKVTSPGKLGIMGGSNGGLLTGVMLTQRPDLFGAVVCAVPLLDMKRYHKLLAGASWMEEYGDPDKPDDWAAIAKYSPYQNVHAGTKYPRTLFTSSTRDDRVHPGHARKMVARMLEQGHDVLYYENIEGGHGGAADNEQAAFMTTLYWTFFAKQLGLK